MPGEGLGHKAQRGLQGRSAYSPAEGLQVKPTVAPCR